MQKRKLNPQIAIVHFFISLLSYKIRKLGRHGNFFFSKMATTPLSTCIRCFLSQNWLRHLIFEHRGFKPILKALLSSQPLFHSRKILIWQLHISQNDQTVKSTVLAFCQRPSFQPQAVEKSWRKLLIHRQGRRTKFLLLLEETPASSSLNAGVKNQSQIVLLAPKSRWLCFW